MSGIHLSLEDGPQSYRTSEKVIAGAVLTFVDITDRKRAAEVLREVESRYRQLLQTTGAKDIE